MGIKRYAQNVVIALIVLAVLGLGLYRFMVWGMSDPPTEQESGFDAVFGVTTRNFIDDERGIAGPSDDDIQAVNRDGE